ncbi:tRNA-guanine transglycosylase DpdA [Tuwongella immobilis]|uniref:Queuine other trna-ribosyltransferase: Uncharacterized protein n=1 Tax=Tuwongella immobilis TaxID=692036 RepID=A0A6C2YWX5_9BACT|nr:tRNA-guanine transglycosylase DpdA [Tuwongella immobilis]VIP05325.1 queuine other trna-ribosyltransferase : Uncharacterized protein OS=mine drainage metagenome GN=CARN3_0669 PE=4 SV=1 [Tuwongella immobilis]VTS08006.1 queuine other trna-ribosyltransferase : Uncharacterized protein OS=mine drainage metagenome GN=CARN3_0669 PE=4 SV=1 [Tuwongella immobilis]
MKFFFPDAQDLVDPSFGFVTEKRSESRLRHRDDQYAHEVFSSPPYDGMLISKAIVDGHSGGGGRYTLAQRQRLLRCGAREFLRLPDNLKSMGDCGAFSYVQEKTPPVTVDEVIDFYEACGVDYGVSVDHIILAFQADIDGVSKGKESVPKEWLERQTITLELAEKFLKRHNARHCRFIPVGVAQGWSPKSYADSVSELQNMGYTKIGMGGMVPLKSHEIVSVLESVSEVRAKQTELHLFGVTRLDYLGDFAVNGVMSFDSTSPLRQAFKDDRDNYYTTTRTYTAVKVPQVQGNAKLQTRIVSGEVKQPEARRLERACFDGLLQYDRTGKGLESVLRHLREYELIHDAKRDHTDVYRETLSDRPWEKCPCEVCRALGIHVVIFRGAERNRRRGFHNLFVTYRKLGDGLAARDEARLAQRPF